MDITNHHTDRQGLNIGEACHIAGIGRSKLYDEIASGRLRARKLGKRRIILRHDLDAFLEALPTEAKTRAA